MMRRILQPFRLLGVVLIIVSFLATMSVVWIFVCKRWRRVLLSNQILSYFCIWSLWNLKIKVRVIGEENLKNLKGALFVGNHLTYADVLVISSRISACFVTSTEIKRAPVLGQICQMAGCLFVERKNKMNILNEVSELREGLEHGLNVAIFPEATSTNGEQVLRFRKPLYLAAVSAQSAVVPFCLNYRTVGGRPIDKVSRDSIFWYGDMDFAPHIWRLSGSGGVEVDIHFLPPIPLSENSDASEIAQQSQAAVESVFIPVNLGS